MRISNGNITEWSTIQGVIGRVIIFQINNRFEITSPRKNTSNAWANKMSARIIIMLNHGTRGLLFHYKKCCYFFGKSIQKYPDSVCENDVTMSKMFARSICQNIE